MVLAIVLALSRLWVKFNCATICIDSKDSTGYLNKKYPYESAKSDTSFYLASRYTSRLYAVLRKNNGKNIILLLHDSRRSLRNCGIFFDFFESMGYDCFSFDYHEVNFASSKSSYTKAVDDVINALRWLQESGYKQENILIYSESNSYLLAAECCLRLNIRGLIIVSAQNLHPTLFCGPFAADESIFSKLKLPVLFIHGDNDVVEPVTNILSLYNFIAPSVRKQVVILSYTGHYGFYYNRRYFDEICKFFPAL